MNPLTTTRVFLALAPLIIPCISAKDLSESQDTGQNFSSTTVFDYNVNGSTLPTTDHSDLETKNGHTDSTGEYDELSTTISYQYADMIQLTNASDLMDKTEKEEYFPVTNVTTDNNVDNSTDHFGGNAGNVKTDESTKGESIEDEATNHYTSKELSEVGSTEQADIWKVNSTFSVEDIENNSHPKEQSGSPHFQSTEGIDSSNLNGPVTEPNLQAKNKTVKQEEMHKNCTLIVVSVKIKIADIDNSTKLATTTAFSTTTKYAEPNNNNVSAGKQPTKLTGWIYACILLTTLVVLAALLYIYGARKYYLGRVRRSQALGGIRSPPAGHIQLPQFDNPAYQGNNRGSLNFY